MTTYYETSAPGLTLRPFQPDDRDELLKLNAYGLTAAGIEVHEDYYAGEDMDDLEETYGEAAGGLMIVGETNKKIVAMGGIRRLDATICELLRMRTYPEYQRLGYGRTILEVLEREARRLGYQRIMLLTGENQHPAVDLYARHGYQITRREILIRIPSVHRQPRLVLHRHRRPRPGIGPSRPCHHRHRPAGDRDRMAGCHSTPDTMTRVAISGHRGLPADTDQLIGPELARLVTGYDPSTLTGISLLADGPDTSSPTLSYAEAAT